MGNCESIQECICCEAELDSSDLMDRIAMKDFTFSDGTTVPAGATVTAMLNNQTSEEFYENPTEFDGFRFVKMREQAIASGRPEKKFDIISTGIESLPFGHGRHACPGRYFAAAELKMMLAHLVVGYDIRTVEDGLRPADIYIIQACIPNPTAEILIRKRNV